MTPGAPDDSTDFAQAAERGLRALLGPLAGLHTGAGTSGASGASAPEPEAGMRTVPLGRHVSVRHALQACGCTEAQARDLADSARRDGRTELRHAIAPGAAPHFPHGGTLIVRRMPGNHAEAWALLPLQPIPENRE